MISIRDVLVVGYALSRIVKIIAVLLLLPIPVAVIYQEWSVIGDFVMAASLSYSLALIMQIFFYTEDDVKFKHAMVVSAFIWIFGSFLAGLPLWISGTVNTPLDATFDGMSAWTTTGLTMIPDVDHVSYTVNFWRHLTQFVGGAGIVVFALALLTRSVAGAVRLYSAEGREEKIFPSITKTAKAILGICLVYLLFGSLALSAVAVYEGMPLGAALFDGVMTSMAGFSTGGFSTHSQSILFYHSTIYELVAVILFVAGSFNFTLHFAVLTGNRTELKKNIEILTFSITLIALTIIIMSFLLYFNVYSDYVILFKKGFFQLISGHTTTGFQSVNSIQMAREWPYITLFAVTVSMILGACSSSTAGGIKALRVGLIIKMFIYEIKRVVLPESAVIVEKYHHIHPATLSNRTARGALLIAIGYIILFTLGSLITMFYGYSMIEAMFETASAVANTGLSVGIANYQAPPVIKITYLFLMWMGRLEIIAVFVLVGVSYLALKRAMRLSIEMYRAGEKVKDKVVDVGRKLEKPLRK